MAEGAHLTSAATSERPSIFEVLAQESLISAIRPAFKHAIRVFAENRPDRYGWMLKYYDEMYTVLDLLLESYYLKKYCASFSENFYGLKRVAVSQEMSSKLPSRAFWKSLVCLACVPYIKQKLDEKFEDMRHELNTHPGVIRTYIKDWIGQIPSLTTGSWSLFQVQSYLPLSIINYGISKHYAGYQGMSRLTRTFVAVYPYIHTVWEGSIFWYQAAYMFGKTDWHSPFIYLSDVTLAYDSETVDDTGQQSHLHTWQDLSSQQKLFVFCKKIFNVAAVSVSTGLSVGVFFIQFLDWWYANDVNATSLTSLPVPDPPEINKSHSIQPYDVNICPICHRKRSNDTALSVSGYVFCYPCVYDYVKQYAMCPITNYPARTEHLIKLYLDDS